MKEKCSFSESESDFFSYIESLGFYRDKLLFPNLFCYRRVIGTSWQMFHVDFLEESSLFLMFYEKKIGNQTERESIFYNFTLDENRIEARGCLVRKKNRRKWTCLKRSLFKAKHLTKEENINFCFNHFNEVLEWWESKKVGNHLFFLFPMEIPSAQYFEPITIQKLHPPYIIQRFLAIEFVWVISFFAIAVNIAALLAFSQKNYFFLALIPSSIVGFVISYFLHVVASFVCSKINGAPFVKGDIVQVIRGKYAGKVVRVYEEWTTRGEVRVAIDRESWLKVKDVFSDTQLLRLSPKQKNKKHSPFKPKFCS